MELINAKAFKKILEQRHTHLLSMGDCYGSMAGTLSGVIKLLDKAPREMKWISVKDRIPQEGENVLCYDGDLGVINVCWFSGEVIQWTDGEFVGLHVTHWMSLPEPPDEGNPF